MGKESWAIIVYLGTTLSREGMTQLCTVQLWCWPAYQGSTSLSVTKGVCLPLPFLSCSIDKISKVTSPVLVIHGTEDEVIDFSHGLAMYERCPRAVEPLWVEGAGHNDIELYAQYLERLKQFISHELPNSWRWQPTLPHYCEARILVCTCFDWI